jgi:hypothetical protein
MELGDIEDLIDQIPDEDGYETNAFLMDLESALITLMSENEALLKDIQAWRRVRGIFEASNKVLKDDRDRFRDDLNAMYEWLAVEFPQAFASLKMKVLNPDALLTEKETP